MENIIDEKKIFSEVYEFINKIDKKYYEKLPKDLIKMIDENRDVNYKFVYDEKKELKDQITDKNVLSVICLLDYSYWCEDESRKQELYDILKINQEILENKYTYEEIFKKDVEIPKVEQDEVKLVKAEKESIFKKIKQILKKYIKE